MTPEQKTLVRKTWLKVAPNSQAAAGLFYDRLFELDPALRSMFAQTDMRAQKSKLVQALSAATTGRLPPKRRGPQPTASFRKP